MTEQPVQYEVADGVATVTLNRPDVLNAMSQGNDGSLSTIHATSSLEVVHRIALYAIQAPERLPWPATVRLVAGALDFVVFLRKERQPPAGERDRVRRFVDSIREIHQVDQDDQLLTTELAAIMFPYLICMSLGAMMAGMLNSLHRYFAAAIAPVFLNIILVGILVVAWYGGYDGRGVGLALGWGVLAAGVVQLAIVFFAVRHAGVSIGFRRPRLTPNVRRLLWLALPAAITGGITQINTLVGTAIASGQAGAVRHGISRALTLFEPDLRPTLKQGGFLTRDPRTVERKKYGRRKARRSFQFSKR